MRWLGLLAMLVAVAVAVMLDAAFSADDGGVCTNGVGVYPNRSW